MGFAERAIAAFERALEAGTVSEGHVRDVLRSATDGMFAVKWLGSSEVAVRKLAARIVSEKGPVEALVEAAAKEKDRSLLIGMIGMLGKPGARIESLECFLGSEDIMVRDAAVDMFVKAGKKEFLFPMVFSEDDVVAKRTKRLMDAKGKD